MTTPLPTNNWFFKIEVPREVSWKTSRGIRTFEREEFFAFLWAEWTDEGLVGVHEGTLLSEQAFEAGLETESWTVDSGEAPRGRDWVESQPVVEAQLYFSNESFAKKAHKTILENAPILKPDVPQEQPAQDWDAEWKAQYKGIFVAPFWEVRPPWFEESQLKKGNRLLRINPGAGFGTGTHETTQLCMGAIAEATENRKQKNLTALDFGSGSGILSVALALCDVQVDGVEIDPLANENAAENAALNGVENRVRFVERLDDLGEKKLYPLVVANILRPVLVEFCGELTSRLAPGGTLILSGLIESDIAEVSSVFQNQLRVKPEIRRLGEWRALVFN